MIFLLCFVMCSLKSNHQFLVTFSINAIMKVFKIDSSKSLQLIIKINKCLFFNIISFLVNVLNSVKNLNHKDWTLYRDNLRPKFSS